MTVPRKIFYRFYEERSYEVKLKLKYKDNMKDFFTGPYQKKWQKKPCHMDNDQALRYDAPYEVEIKAKLPDRTQLRKQFCKLMKISLCHKLHRKS